MKLAICAIVKNEHRYFKEWAEHHLRQGFELYVFEDFNSRSHAGLVSDPRLHLAPITDFQIPQIAPFRQYNLYQWFLDNYRDRADWTAFIDADEFLFLQDGWTWDALCHEFRDETGVCLFWRTMGANGHIERPDLPLVEAYTKENLSFPRRMGWNYKSFVNMHKATTWDNIHHITDGCFTNHAVAPQTMYVWPFVHEKAWINHYQTKSWEDWVERMKMGAFTKNYRNADTFFGINPELRPRMRELVDAIRNERFPAISCLSYELGIYTGGNLRQITRLNGN